MNQPPPGAIVEPTLDELREWARGITDAGITVDLETADEIIRCMSLCRIHDEVATVVWFRTVGGGLYWGWGDLLQVVELLRGVLEDPCIPKVLHNGASFDWPIILRHGFRFANYGFDTLLGQHIAYPDAPKALEFVAGAYADLPRWKHLVSFETKEVAK
jgi:hypothetical protein